MIYPTFTKGQAVESSRFGQMTFLNMDTYGNQTSYRFLTPYGTRYILPQNLGDHFHMPATDAMRIDGMLTDLRTMRDKSQGDLRHTFNEACDRLDVLLSAVNEAKDKGNAS